VSNIEHWTLDHPVGASSVNVTLSWESNGGILDTSDLIVARFNTGASQWENEGKSAVTGNNSNGTVSSNPVSTFSPFAIGTTLPSNPLPIELISFNVFPENMKNRIEWFAIEDASHDNYILERSSNGSDFERIHVEMNPSDPESKDEIKAYTSYDKDPMNGWNYYRLVDIDYNGTKNYSEIRGTYFKGTEKLIQSFVAFPNPARSEFQLRHGPSNEFVEIQSISGAKINSYKLNTGSYQIKMQISDLHFCSGMYFFKLDSGKFLKLFVE